MTILRSSLHILFLVHIHHPYSTLQHRQKLWPEFWISAVVACKFQSTSAGVGHRPSGELRHVGECNLDGFWQKKVRPCAEPKELSNLSLINFSDKSQKMKRGGPLCWWHWVRKLNVFCDTSCLWLKISKYLVQHSTTQRLSNSFQDWLPALYYKWWLLYQLLVCDFFQQYW